MKEKPVHGVSGWRLDHIFRDVLERMMGERNLQSIGGCTVYYHLFF